MRQREPKELRALARRGAVTVAVLGALGPSAAHGKSLSWLPMDEAPQQAQIFERIEADAEWSVDFIVYLARILLNYDEASATWWKDEVVPAVEATLDPSAAESLRKTKRAAKLRDVFADFTASVEVGLRRYQEEGRRKSGLLKRLVDRYGSTPERRRQLALAFCLLEDQPLELLSELLASLGLDTRLQAVFSPALPDYLAMDPSRLLPDTQYPVWDGGRNRWVIPGLQAAQPYRSAFDEIDRGAALSVFGVRGAEVVVKERPLTLNDYRLFALSGALGCSVTHSLVIPLDVVKTRLQAAKSAKVSDASEEEEGLLAFAWRIQRTEGAGALLAGWEPTVLGYLWYGVTVYPGYEFFKRLYVSLCPIEDLKVFLVLLAGATATIFACIGVCPAEACRIRQVCGEERRSLPEVLDVISAEAGGLGTLFDGFQTLLIRQVLFGMMKFLVFDYFADFVFDLFPFLANQTETQLLVSLLSGAVAGLTASIVSQPADTILTRMNQKTAGRAFFFDTGREIWEEQGVQGFFAGLGSRSVWAACIISGQFFLYDVCKAFLGVKDLRMFLNVQV